MTSVDGGCPGVQSVKEGVIGATSLQYPLLMASMGVEAVAEFAKIRQEASGDARASISSIPGLRSSRTSPVEGIESITSEEGAQEVLGMSRHA